MVRRPSGIVVALLFSGVADGALGGLIVDVNPENPTTVTPVFVSAWEVFGDPGQDLVGATYFMTDNQILIDVIMQDLHSPGTFWPLVITLDGGTVDLGVLAEGSYEVNATMYMIPWFGGAPTLYDTGVASFDVVPEPSTLCLFAVGSLAVVRRRLRSSFIPGGSSVPRGETWEIQSAKPKRPYRGTVGLAVAPCNRILGHEVEACRNGETV